MITRNWKNKQSEISVLLEIDEEKGIELKISDEVYKSFGKDIQELQTLSMYPPLDEAKVAGEKIENNWVKFVFKKGANWERAKSEIINTFDFWLGSCVPEIAAL